MLMETWLPDYLKLFDWICYVRISLQKGSDCRDLNPGPPGPENGALGRSAIWPLVRIELVRRIEKRDRNDILP